MKKIIFTLCFAAAFIGANAQKKWRPVAITSPVKIVDLNKPAATLKIKTDTLIFVSMEKINYFLIDGVIYNVKRATTVTKKEL